MESTIRYTCNGPRVYRIGDETVAIADGTLMDGEYLGHQGCGHDLTALMDALPADGLPHEVACPRCETVGTHMRTPPTPEA